MVKPLGICSPKQVEAQLRQVQLRHAGVDAVQVADGVHVHAQAAHHGDAHQHGDERARDVLAHARPQHKDGQAHQAHDERLDVEGGEVRGHGGELVHGLDGVVCRRVREAEQILELAGHDGHRDARGEARGDGVGHEADEGAQAEQAHEDEQSAGDDGGRDQSLHAARGNDARHDGGERRRGPEICTALPPSSAMRKPATMAVYRPCSGPTPDAMASAMDSGSATMATTTPATTFAGSGGAAPRGPGV